MSGNNLNAYKKIVKICETPREMEARILTQGAVKLQRCLDLWEEQGMNMMLYEALKYNKKIWTLFFSEVQKADNPQPPETKTNLLSLSVFILKRITSIMENPSPEKLNSIININMTIAEGLAMKSNHNPIQN
jgi:flagellar biosynthesis activator protein FlaF